MIDPQPSYKNQTSEGNRNKANEVEMLSYIYPFKLELL